MDQKTRKNLVRLAKDTELRATESLLRWKYKKEGKDIPDKENLAMQSRNVADQAHQILTKSGKSVWQELKKAWKNRNNREDDNR